MGLRVVAEGTVQEQEQRLGELREKLAQAKIDNVRGIEDPSAIFGPVPDFEERRRPITRMFFAVYDNLGGLMAVNFFTFLLTAPLLYVLVLLYAAATHSVKVHGHLVLRPEPVAPLLPLLVVGLIAAPAWAAASSYCAKIVEGEMHPLGEYWSDYRRFAGRGVILAVGQWAIGFMLLYATGWYLGQAGGPFKLVGIVSLYALVFWALCGLYLWPLMVRGYSWRSVLRNAGVLVIAAPLRSAGMLFLLLVLTVILSVTGIGLVVLALALWAILPNQALVLTRERMEQRGTRSGSRR